MVVWGSAANHLEDYDNEADDDDTTLCGGMILWITRSLLVTNEQGCGRCASTRAGWTTVHPHPGWRAASSGEQHCVAVLCAALGGVARSSCHRERLERIQGASARRRRCSEGFIMKWRRRKIVEVCAFPEQNTADEEVELPSP